MSDFIDSDLPLPQIVIILGVLLFIIIYNLCLGSGTKISLSLCLPVMIHTWMFTWYRWEGESWEETQQQFDLNFRASNQVDWITSLSLRLHSYWGSLKSRKIPPTERGDLKRSWIYRTPCPTQQRRHYLFVLIESDHLSPKFLPFFFIACRVSNLGGLKFVPCFKNNIPKQTWWIRGDISF